MIFTTVSLGNLDLLKILLIILITGKLKAFSGSSMNQMKNIRDQQERLSKLHFDLGMSTTTKNEAKNDQMAQLVQKLNEISHSIEKLNSSNTDS